jgi:hypothetical protein
MVDIDINSSRAARAAKREGGGAPITVSLGPHTFELPAELPFTIVERVLDPDVEIAQLIVILASTIKQNIGAGNAEKAGKDIDAVVDVLVSNSGLPYGFLRAVEGALQELFGDEQWAQVKEAKPSIEDMADLIGGLIKTYGVRLGESFASLTPAAPGGATSQLTSSASTTSTPEGSGPTPELPASSEPAA